MLVTYTDGSGNEVLVTPSNPLPTSAGGASSSATDPVKVTGSLGALNATLAITQGSRDTLVMHVQGTFVGTIVLQGSGDGTNWITLNGATQWQNIATNANLASITAVGLYQTTISALPFVRVLMSAYTSGTANLVLESVDGNAAIFLDSPLPAGGNVIGNVGLSGSGGVLVTKAASTPAATADISAVVTQSPNYVAAATGNILALASTTNATLVKGSAASLFTLDCTNLTAAVIYVHLYNVASAPTVGTTVPVLTIPVPITSGTQGPILVEFGQYGKRFPTGLAYAVTTGIAATDATAITTVAGTSVGLTFI